MKYYLETDIRDSVGKEIKIGDTIICSTFDKEDTFSVKFGEYEQDGSGGEYRGSKCLGVYCEMTERKDRYDDENHIWDWEKQQSILEIKSHYDKIFVKVEE